MTGVYVGSFTKQTSTGNQDITLPAGCPDLTSAPAGSWAIMFWGQNYNGSGAGTWSTTLAASIGFVANGGGPISQYSASVGSLHGVSTTDTARRMAAKALTITSFTGAHTDEADFVSFPTATTFRLNWTLQSIGLSTNINFIIFTGLTNAKVINWTTATSVGSKTVTGVGFKPDLVLHASAPSTGATIPYSGTHAYFSFGAMNKHGQQWANAFVSGDATSPSNTSRWQQTDATYLCVDQTESPFQQAHFEEMNSDGFKAYFSATSATAVQVVSLCMDGISSKLGAFSRRTSPGLESVSTRQDFIPKGALFSSIAGTPMGAPSSWALWSLGATDLTNQRSSAIGDRDAVNPTNAQSLWRNDASLLQNNEPGNLVGVASVTGVSEDSLDLNWSVADVSARESLYLLVGDDGTDTFPAKVNAHQLLLSTATALSNQKKGVELSTERKVVVTVDTVAGEFWWSDDGVAWTNYSGGHIFGWSNGSIDAYVDSGGTERLVAAWRQSGTGGGRTDGRMYGMVGTFNSDRTTLTWGSAVNLSDGQYPDVVVCPEGSGAVAYVVSGYSLVGGDVVATRVNIDSSGVITSSGHTLLGPQPVAVHPLPSITIDLVSKRLFLAYSRGTTGSGNGIRFRTASYSAGVWTWASEVEVSNDIRCHSVDNQTGVVCRWDGTAVIIGVMGLTAASTWKRRVWESTNFTSFTSLLDVTSTGAVTHYGLSMAVDPSTRDIFYLSSLYSNGQYDTLSYFRYRRSLATWDSAVHTDRGLTSSSGVPFHQNAFPITSGIGWIYTTGNNPPYAVKYDRIQLNQPPNTPTNLQVTSDGWDTTPVFSTDISDPDTGQNIRAEFEIYQSDGSTLIDSVSSTFRVGDGNVTAEYTAALPVGTYNVRAQTVDDLNEVSNWTALVEFNITDLVSKDVEVLWNVNELAIVETTFLWNVAEANIKDISLHWNVYGTVSPTDLVLRWRNKNIWTLIPESVETWSEIVE